MFVGLAAIQYQLRGPGGTMGRGRQDVKKEQRPSGGRRGSARSAAAKPRASKSIAPLLDAENAAALASSGQGKG